MVFSLSSDAFFSGWYIERAGHRSEHVYRYIVSDKHYYTILLLATRMSCQCV